MTKPLVPSSPQTQIIALTLLEPVVELTVYGAHS
jgi:hypothetical protein